MLNSKAQLIINERLKSLQKSKFRSHFYLKEKELHIIDEKGFEKIKEHAYDIIKKNIACYNERLDGKQTPMKGHPVFIAQHATATCCRGCLEKWHYIPKDKILTEEEGSYIVDIIMSWINKEYNSN